MPPYTTNQAESASSSPPNVDPSNFFEYDTLQSIQENIDAQTYQQQVQEQERIYSWRGKTCTESQLKSLCPYLANLGEAAYKATISVYELKDDERIAEARAKIQESARHAQEDSIFSVKSQQEAQTTGKNWLSREAESATRPTLDVRVTSDNAAQLVDSMQKELRQQELRIAAADTLEAASPKPQLGQDIDKVIAGSATQPAEVIVSKKTLKSKGISVEEEFKDNIINIKKDQSEDTEDIAIDHGITVAEPTARPTAQIIEFPILHKDRAASRVGLVAEPAIQLLTNVKTRVDLPVPAEAVLIELGQPKLDQISSEQSAVDSTEITVVTDERHDATTEINLFDNPKEPEVRHTFDQMTEEDILEKSKDDEVVQLSQKAQEVATPLTVEQDQEIVALFDVIEVSISEVATEKTDEVKALMQDISDILSEVGQELQTIELQPKGEVIEAKLVEVFTELFILLGIDHEPDDIRRIAQLAIERKIIFADLLDKHFDHEAGTKEVLRHLSSMKTVDVKNLLSQLHILLGRTVLTAVA